MGRDERSLRLFIIILMTFWCVFNFHRNQYAQITVDDCIVMHTDENAENIVIIARYGLQIGI